MIYPGALRVMQSGCLPCDGTFFGLHGREPKTQVVAVNSYHFTSLAHIPFLPLLYLAPWKTTKLAPAGQPLAFGMLGRAFPPGFPPITPETPPPIVYPPPRWVRVDESHTRHTIFLTSTPLLVSEDWSGWRWSMQTLGKAVVCCQAQ